MDRSGSMEQNLEDVIANFNFPGWEAAIDRQTNRVYYVDHTARTTTWLNPTEINKRPASFADCIDDELPYGWERLHDEKIGIYFVNDIERRSQITDPRIEWHTRRQNMFQNYLQKASKITNNNNNYADDLQRQHQQSRTTTSVELTSHSQSMTKFNHINTESNKSSPTMLETQQHHSSYGNDNNSNNNVNLNGNVMNVNRMCLRDHLNSTNSLALAATNLPPLQQNPNAIEFDLLPSQDLNNENNNVMPQYSYVLKANRTKPAQTQSQAQSSTQSQSHVHHIISNAVNQDSQQHSHIIRQDTTVPISGNIQETHQDHNVQIKFTQGNHNIDNVQVQDYSSLHEKSYARSLGDLDKTTQYVNRNVTMDEEKIAPQIAHRHFQIENEKNLELDDINGEADNGFVRSDEAANSDSNNSTYAEPLFISLFFSKKRLISNHGKSM